MSGTALTRVVIIAEYSEDGRRLAGLFKRAGIEPVQSGGLTVVAARTILTSELSRINREHLEDRRPWLLMRTAGDRVWVGPLFQPGGTGCWECLAYRLRENGWRDSSEAANARMLQRAAEEACRWVAAESAPLGRIFAPGQTRTHELVRRPQCPACGRASATRPHALRLQSRYKIPGSDRTCPADATITRLTPHVSELTGVVSEVSPARAANGTRMVFASYCRPAAPPLPEAVVGKGSTARDALASCLAEAVERYSIQWHGDERVLMARQAGLDREAIGLRDLALWSSRQMRRRTQWNREIGGFSSLPLVPHEDADQGWTAVWSLSGRRWKYVPASYCYLYYPGGGWLADSNGCAGGNAIEEAILHGFLELVEREAVGIWWYNRLRRAPVEIDGPAAAAYEAAARQMKRRERSLQILDLTTDFGIPVFAAVSVRRNRDRIAIGTGAHLNPEAALGRALAELCQVVHGFEQGVPRASARLTTVEQALRRWMLGARIANHPYLVAGEDKVKLSQLPNLSKEDVKEEIEWCIAKARRLGLEVLVLDMTRPEIGFPVARVIVPGMRHCWARLAPGRLYDVPVKMGWQQRRLREAELNPEAYFL